MRRYITPEAEIYANTRKALSGCYFACFQIHNMIATAYNAARCFDAAVPSTSQIKKVAAEQKILIDVTTLNLPPMNARSQYVVRQTDLERLIASLKIPVRVMDLELAADSLWYKRN